MYELIFSNKVLRQLKKLDKPTQERIIRSLNKLLIRPENFVRRLVNYSAYKLRVGDYRVILDIDKNKLLILVLKVGHRRNVYK